MSRADERHDISIEEYIASIGDDTKEKDARVLFDMMHRISGEEPILYGIAVRGLSFYSVIARRFCSSTA